VFAKIRTRSAPGPTRCDTRTRTGGSTSIGTHGSSGQRTSVSGRRTGISRAIHRSNTSRCAQHHADG